MTQSSYVRGSRVTRKKKGEFSPNNYVEMHLTGETKKIRGGKMPKRNRKGGRERETKVSFETVGHALYQWVVGGGWGVIQLTSLRLLFLPLHLFSFLHHGLPFDCVFVVAVAATANVFQYPAEPQKPRLVAFIVSASSLRIDLRSLAPLIV